VELVESHHFGGRAHPVHVFDVLGEGRYHVLHQRIVAHFGFGLEIFLHEKLAQGIAQGTLLHVEHALPAGALAFGAT
jgi:hypothetical protein